MKFQLLAGIVCLLLVLGSCDRLKQAVPPDLPLPLPKTDISPPAESTPRPEAEEPVRLAPMR